MHFHYTFSEVILFKVRWTSARRSRPACEDLLLCGYPVPNRRQRYGGTEDVVGIVESFHLGQPFDVGAEAFSRAVSVACANQMRIPAGKCDRVESLPRFANPLLMPALFQSVRPIGKRSENFDQHVVATEAEGGCFHRHARSRASELVAENRASGRDGFRHGLNEKVDAGSVESWKRARFHEGPPPVHDMRVEH